MPARRLALASTLVVASALMGAAIVLAQESPQPGESPMPVASPPAVASLPAGSPAAGSPGASLGVASTVGVTLQEVAVVPETTTIPAGTVTLEATNQGPAFEHELVVVQTDLPADGLPTNEDGSFNEEGEGVTVLGEIEEFAVGTTQSLTVDLTPGHYVFLCNVVDESSDPPFSHYAAGMRVDVEVTEAGAAPVGSPAGSPAASMAPVTSPAPMASEAAASPAA